MFAVYVGFYKYFHGGDEIANDLMNMVVVDPNSSK